MGTGEGATSGMKYNSKERPWIKRSGVHEVELVAEGFVSLTLGVGTVGSVYVTLM